MTAAHPQMQSLHEQMHANALKLQQTQPTDPNYSSIASQVSQTHGSLAAQMMTQQAEVRAQVFKVLTPAQQTQLAALEAQMRARPHGVGRPRRPPGRRLARGRGLHRLNGVGATGDSADAAYGGYRWMAPIPSFLSRSITLPCPTRWPVPTMTR
jgi:hypothetical protein